MSYQGSGDLYFVQERAELIETRYDILERFADAMCFLKKQLKSAGLPAINERMSLHAFVTWVYSTPSE